MAISPLQLTGFNSVNNAVDPSQWSSLGNLGNVYRDAEAARNKQAALSSIGPDMQQNMQTLLRSGDPALVQAGLTMQEKLQEQARQDKRYGVEDTHWGKTYAIQAAIAKRAQEKADQEEEDRAKAPQIVSGLLGGTPTPAAPPTAPAAFPAPLPGPSPQASMPPLSTLAQTAAPPSFANAPPPQTPAPAVPAPVAPAPAALPDYVNTATAAPPNLSVVNRLKTNLVSDHPPAAAGISREQLGAAYANPLTKDLAVAFFNKMTNPGEWTYHVDEGSGRVIATNKLDPSQTKDVTPKTADGQPLPSKEEREAENNYKAGLRLGLSDEQARMYAANKGKMPSEDLKPDERKQINELTTQANNGQSVLDGIQRLKELSPKAWGVPGAGETAKATSFLPGFLQPQGAINTQVLDNIAHQNVAQQAKAVFGSRLALGEVKMLENLEGSTNETDAVRQEIYKNTEALIKRKMTEARAEADAIRNKTFFKPGGGTATAAPDPLGLR